MWSWIDGLRSATDFPLISALKPQRIHKFYLAEVYRTIFFPISPFSRATIAMCQWWKNVWHKPSLLINRPSTESMSDDLTAGKDVYACVCVCVDLCVCLCVCICTDRCLACSLFTLPHVCVLLCWK